MVQVRLYRPDEAPEATGAYGSAEVTEASGAASWEVLPTPLRRFTLGRYDVSVRYTPAHVRQLGGR